MNNSKNILFFLIPKANCSYLYDDFTIRQALQKMESSGYAAIPILDRSGKYVGALREGDLLWAVKNLCKMDLKKTEEHGIMEINHHKDNEPISVTTNIDDLISKALDQNFVPVVDDMGSFIGIITRRAIMQYFLDHYINTETDQT